MQIVHILHTPLRKDHPNDPGEFDELFWIAYRIKVRNDNEYEINDHRKYQGFSGFR